MRCGEGVRFITGIEKETAGDVLILSREPRRLYVLTLNTVYENFASNQRASRKASGVGRFSSFVPMQDQTQPTCRGDTGQVLADAQTEMQCTV